MWSFTHSDFCVLDITYRKMMTKGLTLLKMEKGNHFYLGVIFGKQYKSEYVFGFKYEAYQKGPNLTSEVFACWSEKIF